MSTRLRGARAAEDQLLAVVRGRTEGRENGMEGEKDNFT